MCVNILRPHKNNAYVYFKYASNMFSCLYKWLFPQASLHPLTLEKSDDLVLFCFVCLSACSAGNWGPFLGEDFSSFFLSFFFFFFFFLGGGACQLKMLVPPYENPKPPVPPHWKNPSYATDWVALRYMTFLMNPFSNAVIVNYIWYGLGL